MPRLAKASCTSTPHHQDPKPPRWLLMTRLSYVTVHKFPKHAEIWPESLGIVMCRLVGTVPDILGLAWPSFRPKSGSKSKIAGRILTSFRGPFSSAEMRGGVRPELHFGCYSPRCGPTKPARDLRLRPAGTRTLRGCPAHGDVHRHQKMGFNTCLIGFNRFLNVFNRFLNGF